MINDKDKSKEELIQELETLRQKVTRLVEAGGTEYQRVEDELKKSEQIYRTAFLHGPDYIYLNDPDGFFLDANPATLAIHELSMQEFRTKSFLDFFAGDNLEELIRVSDGLKEGRPVYDLKLRTRTARGQILDLEINAVPLIEDGKVVSVLSMARDISARVSAETKLKQAYDEMESKVTLRTVELVKANQELRSEIAERKRAEETLRKSEELYRTLMRTYPDAAMVADLQGRLIDVSENTMKLLGVEKREDIIGRNNLDFAAPWEREKIRKNRDILFREGFYQGIEYDFQRTAGEIINVEISSSLLRDINGEPRGWIAVARDITARKRAEAALRESEEMYRTLVETSPDVITVMDLEGRLTYASPRIFETYGYKSKKEFLGKHFSELTAPQDRGKAVANFRKSIQEGSLRGQEYTTFRKDGTPLIIESRSSIVRDAAGNPKALIGISRDITERKRAEAALKESEELYRTLVETSPDMISVLDLEGRITYATKKIYEMFGFEKEEEFLGKKVSDFIPPEEQGRLRANIRKTGQAGFQSGNEYMIRRKDGKEVIWEVSSAIIKDAEGKPKAILAINRDVTVRKRAEEALRESEEMYRTLIETSPDVITLLDLEGRITYATGKIYELYGYKTEKEFLGKKALDFVYPEDRERATSNLMKSARLGSLRGNEYPILRKDGKVVVTEVSSALIKDAHGQPKGMIAINRDVTERKRSEEALRESEEMYRTLVETSPDAIITADLEGRITGASQRALEIFGAGKKEDLVGKMSFELIDPKEYQEMKRNLKKLQQVKTFSNEERTYFRINGTSFIGEVNAAPVKDAQGTAKGFFVTIRDITERKRLEKEILEIAAREQRRIGHDLHDGLGQHLAAISFMNQVLENKLAAKSRAEAREAAKISKLISEAISQTRDLARGINPVEFRADGLMSSLRQLSVNLERFFKVSCAFQCARRVLVEDNIISTNLYYIAQEATSNAIKHGKAQHVKIRLAVVRNKLTLSVSDDGVGIPKDFRPNGGLGLQIMNYRSKVIGANLNIRPGRKSGTTVTCSLRAPSKSLH